MTTTLKKTAVGIVLAAIAMFGIAGSVSAQTPSLESLLQQIAALQAQIAQMQGGSTGGNTCGTTYGYTATSTLRVGMSGASVTALQNALNVHGGASLTVDGSYGPATAAAVKAFQMAKGLSVDGVAGPVTQGALQTASMMTGSNCGNDNGGSTGNVSDLNGEEGDITADASLDSDVQIDTGEKEEVIEIEIEAVDGDVLVERLDFMFDARPELYFSEVNLLVDGDEVASLDSASDFSEVGNKWRARFSGIDTIVREDDTEAFTLELKVLSSLAGTRVNDTVNINMDGSAIRFVDGSGAIFTNNDLDTQVSVDVTFFDGFGQGAMNLTVADESPEDATILLDEDTRTLNETVLVFEVEAEDSDIEVQDVTVGFSTTGTTSSVSEILYRAHLYKGSTLLKTKSVNSGTTVTFDDVEYSIDEDDTETFTVKVDFNKTDGIDIDVFTVEDVTVDAEDEDFEAVTQSLTVAEDHQLVVEGLVDSPVSKANTTSSLGDDTIGKFTFVFDLTAYEDDFYIAEDGSGFTVTLDGNGTTVSTSLTSNATLTSDDSFRINKGQTRQFTLVIEAAASTTGTPESVRANVADVTYWTNATMTTPVGGETLTLGGSEYRTNYSTIIDAN